MKKFLKPYLATLMMGTLLLAGTSCKDDDPKPKPDPAPVDEQELITTMTLNLVPEGKGQNVTAVFTDPDGDGGAAPTIEMLTLAPNTTYNVTVTLSDDSKTPPVDITAEVKSEGDEHELFYEPVGDLNVTAQKTDLDKNNRPIGLTATLVTGAASAGKLRVTLKHQPGLKGATSDISKGETDVQAEFPTTIQ